jgi:hypothetical protein
MPCASEVNIFYREISGQKKIETWPGAQDSAIVADSQRHDGALGASGELADASHELLFG